MTTSMLESIPAGDRLIVVKHHGLVRVAHWLNVPLLAGLILSGLSIYWASPVYLHPPSPVTGSRDYLNDLGWAIGHRNGWFYDHFALGTFNLAGALRLHWLFVYLFMINGALYLAGLALGGGWRSLLPRRGDAAGSLAMLRYYAGVVPMFLLRCPWRHPRVATKYNALQKGAYASVSVAGLLSVTSGWAMHKPVMLPWLERLFGSYDGARVMHFWAMWAFVLFLVPHVVLVVIDGWDTMRSMIAGWSERIGGAHE